MPKRKHEELEASKSSTVTQMCSTNIRRLMNPSDANVFGTVHGGHILNLIDETGQVLATQYCNQQQAGGNGTSGEPSHPQPALATLARVERTDFVSPMFVGEVADLHAEVVYTSQHSMKINVEVFGENIIKGTRRLTNKAQLWYVPIVCGDRKGRVLPVPPLLGGNAVEQERARQEYENCKESRTRRSLPSSNPSVRTTNKNDKIAVSIASMVPHSVAHSQSLVTHLVNPADMTANGHCKAGVILKLMDECAGVVAAKHCCTKVATVSFDAINFRHRVNKGSMLCATGRATFTSNRSIEIEVTVSMETVWQQEHRLVHAVDGLVTFVSLDDNNKPLPMPQLQVCCEEEVSRSESGRLRYELYKEKRSNLAKTSAAINGSVSR